NSVRKRIICQPRGTVTDSAWASHRSKVPGEATGESGPITAVASAYWYVSVATAGCWHVVREHFLNGLTP
ncbi:hypothetical protein OJ928_11335, partial [Streptococcus anginosus]|nr:hypothetical protein [Streptococcus anginosus]